MSGQTFVILAPLPPSKHHTEGFHISAYPTLLHRDSVQYGAMLLLSCTMHKSYCYAVRSFVKCMTKCHAKKTYRDERTKKHAKRMFFSQKVNIMPMYMLIYYAIPPISQIFAEKYIKNAMYFYSKNYCIPPIYYRTLLR